MQGKVEKRRKKRAFTPAYVSPTQMVIPGFEFPHEHQFDKDNRWIKLAELIPWDRIVSQYMSCFHSKEGRRPINGRIIIGSIIIKHVLNLTDRETIQTIRENSYLQYFLGYQGFTSEPPFSAPLFVSIRKRLTAELLEKINGIIIEHAGISQKRQPVDPPDSPPKDGDPGSSGEPGSSCQTSPSPKAKKEVTHKGKLLMDATVAPQNIAYPTDLKLLNESRQMCEKIIDKLYVPSRHGVKPRTYRRLARKKFLATAKKKTKSSQEIYKANGQQLRFLRRNLAHIDRLLETYSQCPLSPKELGYLRVIHTVYEQQRTLFKTRSRRIDNRIVNLHQPHVRPIVRGKERSRVEFGSKLQVSLVEGFMFIDKIGWEAYNEGQHLKSSVAQYKARWGYYPECVYADRIYCIRENRRWLAEQGIKLLAKPLGRPSRSAVAHHVRPGDRNPIEGKFGQAKIAFGMDKIRAKLKETSESWIASIALVLNLLNLRRRARLPVQIALEELCRWLEESSGSNRRLMQTIGFGRLHAVHSSYLAWKGQKISILPEYQSSKRPYKIPKSKTGVNTSVFRPLCPINDNYFELRAAS